MFPFLLQKDEKVKSVNDLKRLLGWLVECIVYVRSFQYFFFCVVDAFILQMLVVVALLLIHLLQIRFLEKLEKENQIR